jgi:hypothetical protein
LFGVPSSLLGIFRWVTNYFWGSFHYQLTSMRYAYAKKQKKNINPHGKECGMNFFE